MSPKAKTKVSTTSPLDTASLLADFQAELSRKETEIAAAEAQLAPLRSEADRLRGVIAALQGFDGSAPASRSPQAPATRAGRSDKASRIEAVRGLLEAQAVAGGPKVTRSVVAERLGVSPGYATALLAEARKAQAAA